MRYSNVLVLITITTAFGWSLSSFVAPWSAPYGFVCLLVGSCYVGSSWLARSSTQIKKETTEEPGRQLKPGESYRVIPGEIIPCDGIVIGGESLVDERILTGLEELVEKQPGDVVYGGTTLHQGHLTMNATSHSYDSLANGLMADARLTASLKNSRTPIVEGASRLWLMSIIAVFVVSVSAWAWILHDGGQAVLRALPILLLAYPVGFGLVQALIIRRALQVLIRKGITLKDPSYLSLRHPIQRLVLGAAMIRANSVLRLTDLLLPNKDLEQACLRTAGALAQGGQIPAAPAILDYIHIHAPHTLEYVSLHSFRSSHDRGTEGELDGSRISLGTLSFSKRRRIAIPLELMREALSLQTAGKVVLYVARNTQCLGAFVFQRQLTPQANAQLVALSTEGLDVTFLDHGFQHPAIDRLSTPSADLSQAFSEKKKAFIEELQHQDTRVAVVGGGLRDAPAVAQADIGMLIDAPPGTPCDASLPAASLAAVTEVLRQQRHAYELMGQGLFFSLVPQCLGIACAITGILTPLGLSLVIVGSALGSSIPLLYNKKPRTPDGVRGT